MTRLLFSIAAIAVILIGLATQSAAESRVALVIGNGDYDAIGRLRNPANDADLMARTLAEVGFDVMIAIDQTEDQMGEAIDTFAQRAGQADVAVVYFAGHGIQKDGENYLMPVDAQLRTASAISREAIALNDLTAALAHVPISMIFLDACRNNPFAEALMASAQSDGRSAGIKRGLAVVQTPGDMLVTYATLPDTVASDGTGLNSPFAVALAKHIPTPDTEVSVLMKRVTRDVMAETQNTQRPQQLSQMMTEFYFKRDGTQSGAPVPASEFQRVDRALLTVYPPRVAVGEEVSVFADLGRSCTPSFFNMSSDRTFTPIPLKFFRKTDLQNRQVRFEISPGSRYGLVVQPQDAKGQNTLGYFCEPGGLSDLDDRKDLLRDILRQIANGQEDGVVETVRFGNVNYQARQFWIE